ncbi:uncharacterized protein LOC124150805 [Haliotis rufescens]|uniref:uncharacterized protein LOC124150805 n=1 Tax=Haliotis rufescens TaxID=6454 RepID=UPI001EB05B60|nr:uncharacterized protein LOC124150805 [Haliotis rufescens]
MVKPDTMEKATKKPSARQFGCSGYLIVLIFLFASATLLAGSVLVYLQHIRRVQLPHQVVFSHDVTEPDRYLEGKMTFTDTEGGKTKEVTQNVFTDETKREQVLHISGERMEVYVLQKFAEGQQMAVVFLTNSTSEGSIVMCTDAPLEGEYIPKAHLMNAKEHDFEGTMKMAENFHPAKKTLEFQYRRCADIPKNMFSTDVSTSNVDHETPSSPLVRTKRDVPYGSWCGPGLGGLGLSCCPACNAPYQSCVANTCAPLTDEVDESCFTFKMCEECTSHRTSGLPSCFCIKDFSDDLESSRCKGRWGLMNGPGYGMNIDYHSNGMNNVVENRVNAAQDMAKVHTDVAEAHTDVAISTAEIANTQADTVNAMAKLLSEAVNSGGPSDMPVPDIPAPAYPSSIGSLASLKTAEATADAQREVQGALADLAKANLRANVLGRKKRQIGYNSIPMSYDRRACLKYRSRTMTELMHQRCWCPVFIRVKYVCGYQQVAGSCKTTADGEKCAVKYQICSRIMSKNTLNAVSFQKCPSIP